MYKLSIQDTKTNIYNESDRKVYYAPIKIPALIEYQPKNYEGTDFGQDYTQLCTFAFIREFLKEIRTLIEVGDAIEYNGEWWEIDGVQENEFFGYRSNCSRSRAFEFCIGRSWCFIYAN